MEPVPTAPWKTIGFPKKVDNHGQKFPIPYRDHFITHTLPNPLLNMCLETLGIDSDCESAKKDWAELDGDTKDHSGPLAVSENHVISRSAKTTGQTGSTPRGFLGEVGFKSQTTR